MTHDKTRFLPAMALAAALASPAAAAPDGSGVGLDLIAQGDKVVAAVTLEHVLDLPMELDLSYEVNGQNVKTEPVLVLGPTIYIETIGDLGGVYSVCASIDGLIRINGDLTLPTEGTRCAMWFPSGAGNPAQGMLARGGAARSPVDPPSLRRELTPMVHARR